MSKTNHLRKRHAKAPVLVPGAWYFVGGGRWRFVRTRLVTATSWKRHQYGGALKDVAPLPEGRQYSTELGYAVMVYIFACSKSEGGAGQFHCTAETAREARRDGRGDIIKPCAEREALR